ncbi:hypothetical protein FACS1894200_11480 [Spirochaetia bacterium]|nr:hypothetical protein FACS1894200_11480 [Spirochaetia bacterium]
MRKYKSEAMQAIYEQAEGLYEGGVISKDELLEYEQACCVKPAIPVPVAVPQYPVTAGVTR